LRHPTIAVGSYDASLQVALAILNCAAERGNSAPLTVVCVGTDRSTGDSLGPLTGTLLLNARFPGRLLGTLDSPVHAENLRSLHSDTSVPGTITVAVDACLGTDREVGTIIVRQGALRPGLGVRKKLPPVGDLHIAGVVNIGGFMEYTVLQNTRLSLVLKMAQAIAGGILKADTLLRRISHRKNGARSDDATLSVLETASLRSLLLPEYAPPR
jgi:putative sporulation protein YyaC